MARVPLELVLVNKVSGPLKKANADANKFANTIKNTNGKLRGAAMGTKKVRLDSLRRVLVRALLEKQFSCSVSS